MNRIRSSVVGKGRERGRLVLIALGALAAALVLAGVAGAQVSSKADPSQRTIDGGGGWSRGSDLAIESDVGQAMEGVSSGKVFGVDSGYAHEPMAPPKMWWYGVHLPVVLRMP